MAETVVQNPNSGGGILATLGRGFGAFLNFKAGRDQLRQDQMSTAGAAFPVAAPPTAAGGMTTQNMIVLGLVIAFGVGVAMAFARGD